MSQGKRTTTMQYRNIVAGILAGIAALGFCSCDNKPLLTPTPSVQYVFPTPITKLGSNVKVDITRAQLNEAWDKWRSQGITAYEMTVDHWIQPFDDSIIIPWTYRLRVQGNSIDYLYINEDGTLTTPRPDSGDALNFNDIMSQFSLLDYELANYDPKETSDFSCDVNFDVEVGYPKYIDCPKSKVTKPRGLFASRTMRVSEFKVLERVTPTAP